MLKNKHWPKQEVWSQYRKRKAQLAIDLVVRIVAVVRIEYLAVCPIVA